jgi:mRNA-degrading endonuclease toxin of MazEF toxin-antitoxin module
VVTKRAVWVPRRGDIIRLDFDPSAGHEQQGTRPALVLSPEAFNRFGMALACPVTRGGAFARGHAWTVSLVGAGLVTDGVVLCNQARTVDLAARRAQFIEAVPPELMAEVLARVATLLE